MKILHTSDWHIGCKLYSKDFEEEHNLFFNWLLENINILEIQVLIIAGDIFDIAFPSNNALKLYYSFLTRLQNTTCKNVIIIGGNHDSVSTLNTAKPLLEILNIRVIGGVTENIEDEIIEIKNLHGDTELVVCAVPFLRDKDVRKSVAGENYEDKTAAICEGIIKHYNDIADKITRFKQNNIPVIATGHLFVNDANISEEEHEIYKLGGLQHISYTNFPKTFDYIALGHLHRPQIIGQQDNVRYSGSPIALSFSEIDQQKYVVYIDLANQKTEIKNIAIPKFRNIVVFKGTLTDVVNKIDNYDKTAMLKTWADICITEKNYDPTIFKQVDNYIDSIKNLDILNYKIIFTDTNLNTDYLSENKKTLAELSENEIFDKILDKLDYTKTELKTELKNTFNELLTYVANMEEI